MTDQQYVYVEGIVEADDRPRVRLNSQFEPISNALSPLGAAGRLLVEFMAFRAETTRLDIERQRLSHLADMAQNSHDSKLAAIKADLEKVQGQQALMRASMEALYAGSQTLITKSDASRMAYIEALRNITQMITDLYRQSPLPGPEIMAEARALLATITAAMNTLETASTEHISALGKQIRSIFLSVNPETSSPANPRLTNHLQEL
jgi:hypothetical protein